MANSAIKFVKTLLHLRSGKYLVNRLLELLIGYSLYGLSFITPRNANKWCFGTNVSFTDNSKYLFIYIKENEKEISPIWITKSKNDVKWIRSIGGKAYRKYSLKGLYHCLTAGRYIFTYHSSDINFFTSGNVKKVNLWHGVGIKGGGGGRKKKDLAFSKYPKFLVRLLMPYYGEKPDIFLSTSEMMDNHFMKMFDLPKDVIRNAIYPRCYYMCQPQSITEGLLEKYENQLIKDVVAKIKSFNKTFLYMPTWRGNLSDDFIKTAGFSMEKLNEVLKKKNRLFIFKLHPAVKSLSNIAKEDLSNILILDKSVDVYPLLPYVDCLITDYSSIYYDYILLDKEVILYPFDKEDYLDNSNDLAFDYDEFTPGPRAWNINELYDNLTSETIFEIVEKERIKNAFWGRADVSNLSDLILQIKSL